ncbi:Rho-type gtpase-activating protein [Coemansia sp. RSA 2704]|nr:Rho-type gtpase-activating protein [Coemansia sp. RSA 2704]
MAPASPPLRASLADAELEAGLEAGLAWTEDMSALEQNFVRYSMRAAVASKGSDGGRRRYSGNVRRGEGAKGRAVQGRIPALKRAASMGKSQRSRAASSASVLGNMVPPGLRSSARAREAAGEADGREWLSVATVDQLKEELLVNYGQLCRMEASYQKLRDLYASVIDQLLETRESLQQERGKRAEFESILRSYYGYVPAPDVGAGDGAGKQHRHARAVPQAQAQGSASAAGPKAAVRGQAPAAAQVSRQHSQRRPAAAQRGARRAEEHDSGSDAEDAIITTVPQKATKRFIWPFGGGGHGSHEQGASRSSDEPARHSFHVASTFRASKCDHCQERLKTFTSTVVRCRGCGFVCHQRCAANVTASCGVAGRTERTERAAEAGPFQADAMFGRALAAQAALEGAEVPWIVRAAVAFIEAEGLTMEGVYRRSGSTVDIREVQGAIARVGAATGGRFDDPAAEIAAADMDVTSVTSVLKQYLRDLPDPLLTTDTYQMWVQGANVAGSERARVYRTISDAMPAAHAATLRFLMRHLKRVADHQSENKMTTNNLSVVFAPNILRLGKDNVLQDMANMSEINKTVAFLIQHADDVWPEGDGADAGGAWADADDARRVAAVLSSPSSPTHMRFDDAAGNADLAVSALESMTLSHSMPSPTGQFFGLMQAPPPPHPRTYARGRDHGVRRPSFDAAQ